MESNKISITLKCARSHIQTLNDPKKIFSLPEDIVAEILARLPVKSLLKFRCVSKSWCYLISSKQFIKAHLDNSTKNTNFTHHRIISTFLGPRYRLQKYSLCSLLNETSTVAVNIDFPMSDPDASIRVVGCYNGLCCIIIGAKDFILWNPSTRESKKLPDIDRLIRIGYVTKHGFGFDESGEDYKVLGLVSVFRMEGYESITKVYSLKTNSWKRIKHFKAGSHFDGAGSFVNGKLHWGRIGGLDTGFHIVSFDLGNEVNGELELPSSVEDGGFYPWLGVVRGCLSMVCNYFTVRVDIWVLKHYGVKESWYKLVSIPHLDTWSPTYSTVRPLCISSEGEILFLCASTFAIYDPKRNVLKHPQITNFDEFLDAYVYVQSLVSFSSYPDNEPDEQNQKECVSLSGTMTSDEVRGAY